jgi:hypothetical protein
MFDDAAAQSARAGRSRNHLTGCVIDALTATTTNDAGVAL